MNDFVAFVFVFVYAWVVIQYTVYWKVCGVSRYGKGRGWWVCSCGLGWVLWFWMIMYSFFNVFSAMCIGYGSIHWLWHDNVQRVV